MNAHGACLRPTAKQQRELRRLAQTTGTSFTPPRTRAQASAEIARLRTRRNSTRFELLAERLERKDGLNIGGQDATRVRSHEIDGYGSTSTWR